MTKYELVDDLKNNVKLLKAVSDPSRLRILKMLEQRPLCVCEITEILELATSSVSQHLSILRDADLLIAVKNGKWVDYRLNIESANSDINDLLNMLSNWLNNDKQIINDRLAATTSDRNLLCSTQ